MKKLRLLNVTKCRRTLVTLVVSKATIHIKNIVPK